MANTNGTDQTKLLADLFEYFVFKRYKNVTRSCKKLPDGPLQKIGLYEDTVLHMAARSKQKDLVFELLKLLPEDRQHGLAEIKNKDGNTILHEVATSDDMKDVAEKMFDNGRESLTARNNSGETPIFYAARHGQTEMFKFLADKMKLKEGSEEDVKCHLQRDDKTTVLHISITAECFGLADFIADSYPYLIKERDEDSMTALQYLACNPSAFVRLNLGRPNLEGKQNFVEVINSKREGWIFVDFVSEELEDLANSDWSRQELKKKRKESLCLYLLINTLVAKDTSWDVRVDAQNPMEKFSQLSQEKERKISEGSSTSEYNKSIENPEIVKAILNCHPQVLEHTNKKSHEDPLFFATILNIPVIVRRILIHHPQALEYTDKEGMNILHVAILYRQINIFDMVVDDFEVLSKRLLSATDNKGNSLLHMVGQKKRSQVNEKMQNPALELRQELLLFEKVKKACKVHVTKPLNKEKKTAEELFATRNEKLHQEAKEWLMRTTENCTILSVFIATVAFAAAYTVPGGPNQETGIPILHSKPFFVVFILADVISLTLALTSMGIFLSILSSSFPLEGFKEHLFKKLIQGIICLILSVSMMAVAFGATIILIMKHNWKNVVWHVVAFLPVPIFFLSYSPIRSALLGTGIRGWFKKVVKSIKVVALVALVLLGCLTDLLLYYLIFYPWHACKEPLRTVAKACEKIRKHVRSIRGNTSDTQSPQQTGALGSEV